MTKNGSSQSNVYNLYIKYCKLKGSFHVKPDFLIIGGEKCGTTSLYEYLIQHPNVAAAKGKEIYFFDKKFHNGFGWYRTFFPSTIKKGYNEYVLKKQFMTGEATPRYLVHPKAPERIANLIPNCKFIVLLRNPIDRAYSHYKMEYSNKREKLSFEEAIKNEKERIEGEYEKMENGDQYSAKYYWFSHLDAGLYIKHLERWFSVFPRKQFFIEKSEELFENPESTYNKILNFLELPSFSLPIYKKFKSKTYKKLEPELRKKLGNFFKPYNEKLYDFLGTDFGWS